MIDNVKTVTIGKSWQVELISPLSREGHCMGFVEALPPATPENDGVHIAVGTATGLMGYIVYKSRWDTTKNKGAWHFVYMTEGKPKDEN